MLRDVPINATLPASDLDRARKFYEETLGFERIDMGMPDGVMFRSGDSRFLVYKTQYAGTAKNTAAGWIVEDVDAEVKRLQDAGVEFDTWDLPEEMGEWDGVIARFGDFASAWFRDSEGNILAINNEPPSS